MCFGAREAGRSLRDFRRISRAEWQSGGHGRHLSKACTKLVAVSPEAIIQVRDKAGRPLSPGSNGAGVPCHAAELAGLEQRLLREVGRCSADYRLVEPGDRIMLALSGGKDSYTLLHLLRALQRRAPFAFDLLAVHVDQGQPGYEGERLEAYLRREAYEFRIIREDTYSVVIDKVAAGKTYCALCSRLRRGILYSAARELGCNKLALGHHRQDAIETLLLNMTFSGALSAMPPRLEPDGDKPVVIRPLYYADERQIARFAELMAFPILPCNLCGSQSGLMRQRVRTVLEELMTLAPNALNSIGASLANVRPSHLADLALHRDENGEGMQAKVAEVPDA